MTDLAYIGRPFTPVWDSKHHRISKIVLDKENPLYIDFTRKQHTFIVAKSGGGKSYLAGVYAEELVRVMQNYSVVLIDPMGIFSTLNLPNTNQQEFDAWNEQLPNDVRPAAVGKATIWVPAGDAGRFIEGTFDHVFSLPASELTYGTLCYTFDLEALEPQINLYRKSQAALIKDKRAYTLSDLIVYIRENASEMQFAQQTIDALVTKLDALAELGIITDNAPGIEDIVREQQVAVFDLSQSSTYTARIIVNFLAEKILALRRQITRMVLRARLTETQIEKPSWYVPPVQFVVDEAHNFFPKSEVLRKAIKEGRNCGFMVTAISQSPDLTHDVYANITHLWIGPLVYEDDIERARAMVPNAKKLSDFKGNVHVLTSGSFLYYNIDEKTEKFVRVRPRRTLHPASTELSDERRYFKRVESGATLKPLLLHSDVPVDGAAHSTALLLGNVEYHEAQVFTVAHGSRELGTARVVFAHRKTIPQLPGDFLVHVTGEHTKNAAITSLAKLGINGQPVWIVELEWLTHAQGGTA